MLRLSFTRFTVITVRANYPVAESSILDQFCVSTSLRQAMPTSRCRQTEMIRTPQDQGTLDLQPVSAPKDEILSFTGLCALEDDDFPFEAISDIAAVASWRKEINRPIYHIHKWWAHRLGTVFRAIVLGALTPSGTNVLDSLSECPTKGPGSLRSIHGQWHHCRRSAQARGSRHWTRYQSSCVFLGSQRSCQS